MFPYCHTALNCEKCKDIFLLLLWICGLNKSHNSHMTVCESTVQSNLKMNKRAILGFDSCSAFRGHAKPSGLDGDLKITSRDHRRGRRRLAGRQPVRHASTQKQKAPSVSILSLSLQRFHSLARLARPAGEEEEQEEDEQMTLDARPAFSRPACTLRTEVESKAFKVKASDKLCSSCHLSFTYLVVFCGNRWSSR